MATTVKRISARLLHVFRDEARVGWVLVARDDRRVFAQRDDDRATGTFEDVALEDLVAHAIEWVAAPKMPVEPESSGVRFSSLEVD